MPITRFVASASADGDPSAHATHHDRLRDELLELGADVCDGIDPVEIAERAARRLHRVMDCSDCDIWWLEEGYLRCLASYDDNGLDTAACGRRLILDGYLSTQKALEERELLVISSIDDPRLAQAERDDLLAYDYRSMASLPLVRHDQLVGLIDIFDERERDYGSLTWFLVEAGRSVAAALHNADLLAELRRGNAALGSLVELSNRLNEVGTPVKLARVVAERLRILLAAEGCDIWQVDGGVLRCLASIDSQGWDERVVGAERPLDDYPSAVTALSDNRPLVISNLSTADLNPAEAEAYRHLGYHSMVSLPLIVGGRPIALIDVFDTKVRDYTVHLDLIRNVGQLLSGSFEKMLLVDHLAASNRRMKLITEATLELAGSLDLTTTLRTTAQRLCEAVKVGECTIALIEDEALRTYMHVRRGEMLDAGIDARLSLAEAALTREAIATKRPVVVGSLRDPRLSPAVLAQKNNSEEASWAILPLIIKDRVIGTVELIESGSERTFTSDELETAAAICHAAALAIDNADLFAREQHAAHETRLLYDMAKRTAASLDLAEVAKEAIAALGNLVAFDRYDLLLLNGVKVSRTVSSYGGGEDLVGLALDDLEPGLGETLLAQRVLHWPHPLQRRGDRDRAATGDGAHPLTDDLEETVLIALPSDTGILGILRLGSSIAGSFDAVDTRLLRRVGAQLAMVIKNVQLYDKIKQMHLGALKALSSALNAKDYYTLGHAARVTAYAVLLGHELGWPEERFGQLEEAAYLHDIGKISISDRTLLKPGRLNQQEWDEMRRHSTVSADIIRPLFPQDLVLAVRHHHEHYDGTGYPDGLAGEDIPWLARLLAVVDAYDAMSCQRPYKAARTSAECVEELRACRGTQFDPAIVDAFLSVLDEVARRQVVVDEIAALAAERIRGETHVALLEHGDEDSAEYQEIATVLREVRDANPSVRFLTSQAQIDNRFVICVAPEEDEASHSRFGDEIFGADKWPEVMAGRQPDVTALFADDFGVWVTGLAPIVTADGTIVAVAAADVPALSPSHGDPRREGSHRTVAALLQSTAVRLSHTEIDAITDSLTGLYNHRYLHERLAEELDGARDAHHPLSLLLCDLDHFKAFNDLHGHSSGDAALRDVSHLIEQSVRDVDIACRYGGEEFAILLIETDRDAAVTVAERIRERVAAASLAAKDTALTISIGVACYPGDGARLEDLLLSANRAVHLAKQGGRNQVASAAR